MELYDLVRHLGLSKYSVELLGSRLKERKFLSTVLVLPSTATDIECFSFFSEEKGLVYNSNIAQLLHKFGVPQYQPGDWRLFLDSSKQSLKCVLMHNGNQFASVPLAYSTTHKKYEAGKYLLEKFFMISMSS